jgi:pyruvate dehydrogenase E1 component alpha subunit
MARDPIHLYSRWLVERGYSSQAEIEALDCRVQGEVEEAVAFAEASPFPEPWEAFEHVLAS